VARSGELRGRLVVVVMVRIFVIGVLVQELLRLAHRGIVGGGEGWLRRVKGGVSERETQKVDDPCPRLERKG
jgi:hypothetical protein